MSELDDLYQEILLQHNKEPHHYGALEGVTHQAEGYNPLCGDRVTVYARVDGDRIEDVSFEAASCAICKAAASMMTDEILGKSLGEAGEEAQRVYALLSGESGEAAELETHGDLAALSGVRKFPARVKCATLPWHTLSDALADKGSGKAPI